MIRNLLGHNFELDDTTVRAQYGTLCSDYDGYVRIDDPKKCESAALLMKAKFYFTSETSNFQPSGCYHDKISDEVRFSYHDTGKENENLAPICILGKYVIRLICYQYLKNSTKLHWGQF